MNSVDFERQREEMIERQLKPRGITDPRVIAAFRAVPRHCFVPPQMRDQAYGDSPLAIGEGQTISQPYMVACMTQCLSLRGEERVLEIGTGSGYQTAVLAELAGEVFTVERVTSLSARAEMVLRELGYTTIHFRVGDGSTGWREHAPYDAIIVTAGSPRIPEPLVAQLEEEGRLVIPVGGGWGQSLKVLHRRGGTLQEEDFCDCVFVPLVGEHGWNE